MDGPRAARSRSARAPARSTSAATSRPAIPRYGAAPSGVPHPEGRTLRVDDDHRHAVRREHRQRPRPPAREQGVPGPDQSAGVRRVRVETGIAMNLSRVPDASRLEVEGGERRPPLVTTERTGRRRDGMEASLVARRECVPHAHRRERRQRCVGGRLPVPAHHASIPTAARDFGQPRRRQAIDSLTVSRPGAGETRECRGRRPSRRARPRAHRPRVAGATATGARPRGTP